MDLTSGRVVAEQPLPLITEVLRARVSGLGRYTWGQFLEMISDITLDAIEGDKEAAQWDAFLTLSTAGVVD